MPPHFVRFAVAVVMALSLSPPAFSEETCDAKKAQTLLEASIAQYVKENSVAATERPTVALRFDHPRKRWTAVRLKWSGDAVSVDGDVVLDVQLNNVPSVALRGNDRLVVAVTDTNPLLYAVNRTKAEDVTAPDIADIKAVAGALTGSLTAALAQAGARDLNLSTTAVKEAVDGHAKTLKKTEPPMMMRDGVEMQALVNALDESRKSIEVDIENGRSPVTAYKKAVADFAERSEAIACEEREVKSFVQDAERNYALKQSLGQKVGDATPASVNAAFDALSKAQKGLDGFKDFECKGALLDLDTALQALVAASCDGPDTCTARERYEAALQRLRVDGATTCRKRHKLETPIAKLRSITTPLPEYLLHKDVHAIVAAIHETVNVYVALADARSASSDKVKELEAARPDLVSRAIALEEVADEAQHHWDLGQQCALRHGVLIVDEPDGRVAWDKLGKRGLKISARDSRATLVQRRREDVEATYELTPHRALHMGAGFGPVFTRVSDPAWTAVQSPFDAKQMVIARSDEATRAGKIAAFLTLYPDRLYERGLQFGFDLGAALDTGAPALFLGASVGWRAVRVSTGWNWQRVKRLVADQRELPRRDDGSFRLDATAADATVVTSKDDIRTHDGHDDGWYIALVVNVSSLGLFSK